MNKSQFILGLFLTVIASSFVGVAYADIVEYSGSNFGIITDSQIGLECSPTALYTDGTENTIKLPFADVDLINGAGYSQGTTYNVIPGGSIGGSFFKPDGLKYYLVDIFEGEVVEYDLTTPFDISTRSVNQTQTYADVSAYRSLEIKPDGTKMYMTNTVDDEIHQWSLSIPWDIQSDSYDGSLDVSADTFGGVHGITFSSDGTQVYFTEVSTGDDAWQYDLSVPWDVTSTATFVGTLDLDGSDNMTGQDLIWVKNGDEFWVLDEAFKEISIWECSEPYGLASCVFFVDYQLDQGSGNIRGWAFTENHDFVAVSKLGEVDTYSQTEQTCIVSAKRFDLSSIPVEAVLNSATLEFDVSGSSTFAGECTIRPLINDPSTSTSQQIYDDILDGTEYVSDDTTCAIDGTDSTIDLTIALSDISSSFGSWYGLGIAHDDSRVLQPDQLMYNLDNLGEKDPGWYRMESPSDISSMVDREFIGVSAQNGQNTDLRFSNNGTKMYLIGDDSDEFHQYDLSTPWIVASALPENSHTITEESRPWGLDFNNNGTKMYICGWDSDAIQQYDLDPPWETSTHTWIKEKTGIGNCYNFDWGDSGNSFYISDKLNQDIDKYDCSTSYDVGDCSFDVKLDVSPWQNVNESLTWKPDGTEMWIGDASNHEIDYFTLVTPWDIDESNITFQYSTNFDDVGTDARGHVWADQGDRWCKIGSISDNVWCFPTTIPYNMGTTNSRGTTLAGDPQAMFFKNNGESMYILDGGTFRVTQYGLSEPFVTQTRSTLEVSPVLGGLVQPTGLWISGDGTNMYVAESSASNDLIQYTLSPAWSVISPTEIARYDWDSSGETSIGGIFFRPEGTSVFYAGNLGNSINRHDLSIAWDIESASYSGFAKGVGTEEGQPRGVAFNSDGTNMYVVGDLQDRFTEYTCTTPYRPDTCATPINNEGGTWISVSADLFMIGGTATPQSVITNVGLILDWQTSTAVCRDISDNNLVYDWNGDFFGEQLQGFGVQLSLDDITFGSVIENTLDNDSEWHITGLQDESTYYFQWRNMFFNGTSGDWSSSTSCTTLQGGGGGSPTPDPVCTFEQTLDPNHECFIVPDECTPITSINKLGTDSLSVFLGQTVPSTLDLIWSGNDNLRIEEIVPDDSTGIKLAFQQPIEFPPTSLKDTRSDIPFTAQIPTMVCVDEQTPNCVYDNANYEIPVRIFGNSCNEDFRFDTTINIKIGEPFEFDFRLLLLAIIGMFLIFFIIAKRKKKKKKNRQSTLKRKTRPKL